MQGQILARPSGGVTKQIIRRIEYWGDIRRGAFPAKYKLYKNYPEKKEKLFLTKDFLNVIILKYPRPYIVTDVIQEEVF